MTTVLIALISALATGLVVAAVVVAALRRQAALSTPVVPVDPTSDLRHLQDRVAELGGRMTSSFEQMASGQETVRSALDLLTHVDQRRGVWGEVTLSRLLETAGLVPDVDVLPQFTLPDGSRPDAVIPLGAAGTVVIDAKAPLRALQAAWEADDEEDRAIALKNHAVVVKQHGQALAKRNYASAISASFVPVIMYLPIDGAWEAAKSTSPDIVGDLLRIGVHPASPATLGLVLATLKHHALTVDAQEAALDVLDDTRTLIDRVQTHTDHLGKMGRSLAGAVKAYNEGVGNLATRVTPALRRMTDHLNAGTVEAPDVITDLVAVERVPEIEPAVEKVA